MTNNIDSFFELQYYFTVLSHGKELYRNIKKIENFFKYHSFNFNLTKIKISNKSSVFKYICRKTETSVNNFIKYFGNQIISLRKNFEKIFCTIASAKKKKSIKNVYSKFFKLNLFLCKRKKLTGFLINSYSLKNTKLTIDDFSLFNSNSKYTIWDIIIYFIFFRIH